MTEGQFKILNPGSYNLSKFFSSKEWRFFRLLSISSGCCMVLDVKHSVIGPWKVSLSICFCCYHCHNQLLSHFQGVPHFDIHSLLLLQLIASTVLLSMTLVNLVKKHSGSFGTLGQIGVRSVLWDR